MQLSDGWAGAMEPRILPVPPAHVPEGSQEEEMLEPSVKGPVGQVKHKEAIPHKGNMK